MDVIEDSKNHPVTAKDEEFVKEDETAGSSSNNSFEENEEVKADESTKETDSQVFNVTSSSLCNLLVYTSGESSSSDNSDDSDSYECDSDVQEVPEVQEVVVKRTSEKDKKKVKNATLLDTLKNLGELSIEDLPPVPDISSLNIEVKSEECDEIGKISSIVDKLVMVESIPNKPAYNIDTLLFLDKGKQPLGYIFDVIGAVTCPMYAIRFNSTDEIAALNISKGLPVFSAPKSEHTQYVFVQQLLKAKGSDASWKDDLEVPQEHQDFSDDESEQIRKRSINPDTRKRNSIDRHKNFEKDMNVKNLIDSKLHKIRDNFEPTNKKQTPNNNYKRGYQFQNNFRPNLGFSQPNVSSTSCAFPYSMSPFMPSNMPMQFPPQNMPPFVPNLPPPTANFVSRLPPPLPNPFPMHPYQEMVSPMFPMPSHNPPQQSQAKNPGIMYPPDMGLPRPPTQNPNFVPTMPFFDPRVRMWHNFPTNAPPNTRQSFPKPARNFFTKRQ